MALEALNSLRLVEDSSTRFHGVEQWTKGKKRSKRSRTDHHNNRLTEEEYLAFCLMLLARDGGDLDSVTAKEKPGYKCGVCYKTFSSYQALGGHKASHRGLYGSGDNDKSTLYNGGVSNSEGGGSTTHVSSISHRRFDLNITSVQEFSPEEEVMSPMAMKKPCLK